MDYGQVREKVVYLVQMQQSPDAVDCSQVYGEEEEMVPEAEGYTEEEEAMDLAALADVVCRRCNKKVISPGTASSLPRRGRRERYQQRYEVHEQLRSGGRRCQPTSGATVPELWEARPCQRKVLGAPSGADASQI